MKHVKILGSALAAMGLMAIIGTSSSSATAFCSTTADPCAAGQSWAAGTAIDFSATKTATLVDTEGGEIGKCSSSKMKGEITNAGSSTATVMASVEETTWSSCTFPTKTLTATALEVHKVAGTSNGTVTAAGTFEWTTNTVFFGSCIYGFTSGKDIGTLNEGSPPTFTFNAVVEKFSGSSFACPETSKMTGTYTLAAPAGTTLSVSSN